MTITRVGTATGTTTCTVPAHNIGDLIVIFAYRSGSTSAPSLGSGFTSILTKSGTSCACRMGYRIATSTSDASGTWTSSVALVCHVYTSSGYASGNSLAIGGSADVTNAASSTVNYPTVTMTNANGSSWVAGFAGTSNTSQTIATAPSGMTNESHEVAAANQAAGHDTNGTVSSWTSTNVTTTGTAGDSVSATLEICENAGGSAISNFIQHVVTQPNDVTNVNEPLNNLSVVLPNASLSGNTLVCAVAYPSGSTPAITDNKSNTWPASGASGTVTADAGAGNMALQLFVLNNATAGVTAVTIGFGNTTLIPVRAWVSELCNVKGVIEGSATGTAKNTAGVVSPGSMTPSTNNCLILSYMSDSNQIGTTNPAVINSAYGYTLKDADISFTSGAGTPSASQAFVQGTAAATTALFNLGVGGSETYNVAAVALSTGTQGTTKPTGIHVDKLIYLSTTSNPASYRVQIPGEGNLGCIVTPIDLSGAASTTATDSESTSWTLEGSAGTPLFFFRAQTGVNPGRALVFNYTGHTANNLMFRYMDISGAATSPFDTSAFTGSVSSNNLNTLSAHPSITPSTSNGLVIACMQNGLGPTLAVTAPSGATYVEPGYETWAGTGGIATTTLTTSATTWGSIPDNGVVLTGTGVTLGTSVQSGTGPTYVIQPSQSVTAGTSLATTSTDSSIVNWGNGLAIYYNPNTTAESWTWTFSNQPGNSSVAGAVAFKAATVAAPTWLPPPVRIKYVTRYNLLRR